MENSTAEDAHKRILLIKKLNCDELFFMKSDGLKVDIWQEVEIEIGVKECSDCPEKILKDF